MPARTVTICTGDEQWMAATVVIGWTLSRLLAARPTEDAIRLTWWHVMQREDEAVGS